MEIKKARLSLPSLHYLEQQSINSQLEEALLVPAVLVSVVALASVVVLVSVVAPALFGCQLASIL